MIATDEQFTGRTIYLDGGDFKNCKFIRCKMVFSGAQSLAMSGCEFNECEWGFEGAASNVVHFMSALWAMGGGCKEMIESTFTQIRKAKMSTTQVH